MSAKPLSSSESVFAKCWHFFVPKEDHGASTSSERLQEKTTTSFKSYKRKHEDFKAMESTAGSFRETLPISHAASSSSDHSKKAPKKKNDCTRLNLALIKASEKGKVAFVRQLLLRKADPNHRDIGGYTSLHRAAITGHDSVVKILLNARADMYAFRGYDTAMDYAIMFKHYWAVECLVKSGYDVNFKYKNGTPLEQACRAQAYEIVQYLLSNAAAPHLAPDAIFNATENPLILKTMIHFKADIRIKKSTDDLFAPGAQPLHYAALYAGRKSIEILLEHGADKTEVDAYGSTPLKLLKNRILSLKQTGQLRPEKEDEFNEMIHLLT